ncbi:MAG TPA: TetR/AcrR family transcriptional regulator [Steroidobacteraceae bacterium]|jgi:AcrR family transcriptional regulator
MSYIAERRQEEKERRRAEILDAAEAVAATQSWDSLTMDQVARKARLSRALVYVYFKDKEDLLFGLSERGLNLLKQRFEEAMARNRRGLDQVLGMGRAYIAFSQEFPVFFEVMARCEMISQDAAGLNPNEQACHDCGKAVRALIVAALATGIGDGSVRKDVGDLSAVAIVLYGFTHGVIQVAAVKAKMLAEDGLQARDLMEQALLMCVRSIAATP